MLTVSPHIPDQIWSCYFVAVCEGVGSQLVCSQFCSGASATGSLAFVSWCDNWPV